MKTELVIALIAGLLGGLLLVAFLIWIVGENRGRYRTLLFVTTALTFVVVVVGAYVRLSDAGLGCPDWPGCYGHLDVPKTDAEKAVASAQYPSTPVDVAKGWKEMGHRYIAGLLGLLIVAVAGVTIVRGNILGQGAGLPVALVAIVIMQAALGRWTVTMLLKPVIVTLHLIGGMTILALLTWLSARRLPLLVALATLDDPRGTLRTGAAVALALVAMQIVLGGWVSTNYAALACPDLPLCRGALVPPMDFANAFHVVRELGQTAQGELLSNEALTAIHWIHRLGAIVVTGYMVWFVVRLRRIGARRLALTAEVTLAGQIALGLSNVIFSLPLALAAAHNAGAALLLMVVVVINYRLSAAVLRTR
ncbi:MAG: COX15/CtaA family protein [Burkholderiales bacterium]